MMHLLTAAALLLCSFASHAAATDPMMDGMFNGLMANYTPAGVYQTQSMGVIAGPSYYARSKIVNIQPFTVTPPSIYGAKGAGACSGINMFTGAFSFISSEQLVNMMRAIAANAVPYAFNIALSALCKDCQAMMAWLQQKAQEINGLQKNSCEAVKWIDKQIGYSAGMENFAKTIGVDKGLFTDFLEGQKAAGSASAQVANSFPAETDKYISNVAWQVIKKSSLPVSFNTTGLATTTSNELVQAFTGTIIKRLEPTNRPPSEQSNVVTREPPTLTMTQFLEGDTANMLVCDELEKCLYPVVSTRVIYGFRAYVRDVLFGSGVNGDNGVVGKLPSKVNSYTPREMAFIGVAPGYIVAQLKSLSVVPAVATAYANSVSDYIASEMAHHFVTEMIKAVRVAAAQERDDTSIHAWIDDLAIIEAQITAEATRQAASMQGTERHMQVADHLRANIARAGLRPTHISSFQPPP
jgi:conjugative transfer pilus assembly protein TraH